MVRDTNDTGSCMHFQSQPRRSSMFNNPADKTSPAKSITSTQMMDSRPAFDLTAENHFNPTFSSQGLLHTVTSPVACDQCGKLFHGVNRKFLLNRHKITHTDNRPYQCSHCSYKANVSSNLLRHMRTVHAINTNVILPYITHDDETAHTVAHGP